MFFFLSSRTLDIPYLLSMMYRTCTWSSGNVFCDIQFAYLMWSDRICYWANRYWADDCTDAISRWCFFSMLLQGRLLLFVVVNKKLVFCSQLEVKGAVYNLNEFQGGVLAGINSRVQLFAFVDKVVCMCNYLDLLFESSESSLIYSVLCCRMILTNIYSNCAVMLDISWPCILKLVGTSS